MNSTFLRRVLLADAVVSGAAGLVMIVAAALLAPLVNLPEGLLQIAGAILVPWFVALMWLARLNTIPRTGVMAVIAVNAAWVLGSVAVLFTFAPSLFGDGFVMAQAVAVGLFAELQIVALKREPGAA